MKYNEDYKFDNCIINPNEMSSIITLLKENQSLRDEIQRLTNLLHIIQGRITHLVQVSDSFAQDKVSTETIIGSHSFLDGPSKDNKNLIDLDTGSDLDY